MSYSLDFIGFFWPKKFNDYKAVAPAAGAANLRMRRILKWSAQKG
jgi:hypothetical protein